MSEKVSLATLNSGGIVEAVDVALVKIADNIADINTPAAKPRKLTLEIVFIPDKNRSFTTAKATVKTNLQPETETIKNSEKRILRSQDGE